MSEFSGNFMRKIVTACFFKMKIFDPNLSVWFQKEYFFPVDTEGNKYLSYKKGLSGFRINGEFYNMDYVRSHLIKTEE